MARKAQVKKAVARRAKVKMPAASDKKAAPKNAASSAAARVMAMAKRRGGGGGGGAGPPGAMDSPEKRKARAKGKAAMAAARAKAEEAQGGIEVPKVKRAAKPAAKKAVKKKAKKTVKPAPVIQKVNCRYQVPEGYRPAYVTGVAGEWTPTGELAAHFFLDRYDLPEAAAHEVEPSGALGVAVTRRPAQKALVREVGSGVVMNLETARRLHAWLGARIAEADEKK